MTWLLALFMKVATILTEAMTTIVPFHGGSLSSGPRNLPLLSSHQTNALEFLPNDGHDTTLAWI